MMTIEEFKKQRTKTLWNKKSKEQTIYLVVRFLHHSLWEGTDCINTPGHIIPYTWFSEKRFQCFNPVLIGIQKQMIPHWKALYQRFWISCNIGCGTPIKAATPLKPKKHHFQKHRVKVMIGSRFAQFWVCNQLELLWAF